MPGNRSNPPLFELLKGQMDLPRGKPGSGTPAKAGAEDPKNLRTGTSAEGSAASRADTARHSRTGGSTAVTDDQPASGRPADGQTLPLINRSRFKLGAAPGSKAPQVAPDRPEAVEVKPPRPTDEPAADRTKAAAPAAPTVSPAPGASPDTDTRPQPTAARAEESTTPDAESRPTGFVPGGVLTIPVNWVYWAAAAVLLLCVLTWAAAYQLGAGAGERSVRQALQEQTPVLDIGEDPLNQTDRPGVSLASGAQGSDANADTRPPATERQPERDRPRAEPSPSRPSPATITGAPAYIVAGGGLAEDPRDAGVNYLKLASRVRGDEARDLVRYLDQNGVQAFARGVSGVEPRRGDLNNARYDVYSLEGIPSGQFRASAAQARQLESRVGELGRRWLRQEGGSVDLAQPVWELFRG